MSTTDSIINDVLKREGRSSNDPVDKGGATAFGISKVNNPDAWGTGPPTQEQARQIYMRKYVKAPGFDKIYDEQLQAQLVDFGVNSGPNIAIQKLQEILHVAVDGVLGEETLAAVKKVATTDSRELNNRLVAARIKMIGRIVSRDPSQVKFVNGWLDRALQFIL